MSTVSRFQISRKQPQPETKHSTRYIAAYLVPLIAEVKVRLVRDWRRGISIKYLAKDYQISVRQAEAIVWEAQIHSVPPPSEAAAQERRGLQIVLARAA